MSRTDIRLALPSKGALHKDAFDFLEACGLKIFRPNTRRKSFDDHAHLRRRP